MLGNGQHDTPSIRVDGSVHLSEDLLVLVNVLQNIKNADSIEFFAKRESFLAFPHKFPQVAAARLRNTQNFCARKK